MHHSSKIKRLGKLRFRLQKGGFTLVITLILLAAVVMLVVGMFSSTTLEARITRNYDHSVQAQLAVESGLARAGQLLKRATWSESGVIFPAMEPTSADPNLRVPQRLIGAVPELVGNQVNWTYVPLISGAVVASPDTTSGTSQELRRVQITPASAPVATDLPKTYFWQPKPTTYWESVKEPTPEEVSAGEPSARFCFWIEDLQGSIDLGTAGNFGPAANPMDPAYGGLANARQRKHDREKFVVRANTADYNTPQSGALGLSPRDWYRGLAPGLRTPDDDPNTEDRVWALNQTSLYTLFRPNSASDTATYDNELSIARQFPAQSGTPGASTNLLYAPDVWKAHLASLSSNPMPESALTRYTERTAPTPAEVGRLVEPEARAIEENTIIGTQPYTEMPVVPPYPAPAFAGVLEPKMNLNRVLMQIKTGASTRAQAVDLIANHINVHLPFFKERRGGFPMGANLTDRGLNYLKNLAASMIDYADEDCLPTYDQVGTQYSNWGRFYRGCDSYPIVSEQFMRVKWEDVYNGGSPARKRVKLSVTFFYELWNMSNRPIVAEVQAAYMTNASIQAGTANVRLNDLSNTKYTFTNNPSNPAQAQAGGYHWMPLFLPRTDGLESLPNGTVDRNQKTVNLPPNGYVVVANAPVVFDNVDAGPTSSFITSITLTEDDSSRYCLRMKVASSEQVPGKLFGQQTGPISTSSAWVLIDQTRGTLERNTRSMTYDSDMTRRQQINGTNAGHGYGVNNPPHADNVCDPRAAFYINDLQEVVNYGNGASPWGQNLRNNVGSGLIYGANVITKWPDLGHNCGPNGTQPVAWGISIGSGRDDIHPHHPTILTKKQTLNQGEPSTDPLAWDKRAPMRISNAGRFFSATELGNIFDPVMWDPDGGSETSAVTWSHFADIGSAAVASDSYCGGNTLRIGRMEHSRFRPALLSVPGVVDQTKNAIDQTIIGPLRGMQTDRRMAATALLDLFHCGIPVVDMASVSSGSGQSAENLRDLTGPLTEIRGHVNINTASRDALRALIAGELSSDPVYPESVGAGAQTSPRPPKLRTGAVDVEAGLIADRIIQSRTNLPFLSAAELPERIVSGSKKPDGTINTTIKSVLGDPRTDYTPPTVLPSGIGPSTEWNDTMMEEVFARIYNSATVRSRNFRVFVTGQVRKPRRSDPTQSDVLATRSRVFHVFIKPIRDPNTGLLVDQKIEITHARDL